VRMMGQTSVNGDMKLYMRMCHTDVLNIVANSSFIETMYINYFCKSTIKSIA